MTKEELQTEYQKLSRYSDNFFSNYSNSIKGKNKAIRDSANRQVDSAIDLTMRTILANKYLIDLLVGGGDEIDDFQRSIIFDEFRIPRYFRNDMPDFLEKINLEIQKFDSE